MGPDPVRQILTPCRLGIRITACSKNANKDLSTADFSRAAIDDLHTVSAVVDERLLSRTVRLPHAQIHCAGKLPIELTIPAVAIPLGMLLPVLLPQQLQRHMLATKLGVNMHPVRAGSFVDLRFLSRKQQSLNRLVVHPLDFGPTQRCTLGSQQIVMHRRLLHVRSHGYLTLTEGIQIGQPEHFLDLSHGFSLP